MNVNNTNKLVTSVPLNETELAWPLYGDEVASKVVANLGGLTFGDACNGGCQIGRALGVNIDQLFNLTGESSNATRLRGTEDFLASLVDNTLVNLLLTRLVSRAPQSTEEATIVVIVPSVFFGEKRFIILVGIVNLVIVIAYTLEVIRTRGWAATPPLDIMNDTEVIIAAFQGGRRFERTLNDAALPTLGRERPSDDTMLSLQYDGSTSREPLLMPVLRRHKDRAAARVKEPLLSNVSIPNSESPP